mmetsp:Transcript_23926/g.68733  ORF Transcript_23926/g.68733 Transcript_23926/m.68733 type:complete len:297 (-) Transcript_23926:2751-3641(-)
MLNANDMEPNINGSAGYDGRRLAPAGRYTQVGGEMSGMTGAASSLQQQQQQPPTEHVMAAAACQPGAAAAAQQMPPHPGAFASSGGWSAASSFGTPITPASPPTAAGSGGTFANPSQPPFPAAPPTTRRSLSAPTSSFGSYASYADGGSGTATATGGGSGRKRKCSGDGVETCGSCGHRLMTQRLTSDGKAPELVGYCNSCVCRCALCGLPVLRTTCEETILDEPLLLTARRLGIPLEDSFAMGQEIGLHCRVCADSCMKKLNRMRRMAKRRSSSALLATNDTAGDTAEADGMDMS